MEVTCGGKFSMAFGGSKKRAGVESGVGFVVEEGLEEDDGHWRGEVSLGEFVHVVLLVIPPGSFRGVCKVKQLSER